MLLFWTGFGGFLLLLFVFCFSFLFVYIPLVLGLNKVVGFFPTQFFYYLEISYNAPYHTHFPILPCPPSHPCALPRKQTSKPTKSSLCCPYTHWSMAKLPGKKTESSPPPLLPSTVEEAILQHIRWCLKQTNSIPQVSPSLPWSG